MNQLVSVLILALMLVPVQAAGQSKIEDQASYGPAGAETLHLRGTTDIALFEPVMQAFVIGRPGVRIVYEQWSSNDLYAVSESDCRAGRGVDLVISSSIDQQVKLVNDGCAQPYQSDQTARLPAALNWRNEVFGITREPAVIVYNKALVPPEAAPRSRFDLIDLLRPQNSPFAGKVATYDIQASGLGYLFAFADAQQATTFGALIEAFGRSGAVATCCSAEIINGVVSGRFLAAYNVLGSYALARAQDEPDLAVVAPEDYTLVLSRAALIPRAAGKAALAGAFLDFTLSAPGRQALLARNLIVDEGTGEEGLVAWPRAGGSALRLIPLSPVQLVGLDQHKRAQFTALWRASFPAP